MVEGSNPSWPTKQMSKPGPMCWGFRFYRGDSNLRPQTGLVRLPSNPAWSARSLGPLSAVHNSLESEEKPDWVTQALPGTVDLVLRINHYISDPKQVVKVKQSENPLSYHSSHRAHLTHTNDSSYEHLCASSRKQAASGQFEKNKIY